ncbi:MAG: redoxin domain-containing protein [Flavobacteriales bacterium]|nr:redoxin domain-containing protein [Flavobacteriales bacterium]
MKFERLILFSLGLILFLGCSEEKKSLPIAGTWRFTLDIGEEQVPFQAEIVDEKGKLQFYAINGKERILADQFETKNDSVFIRLPIFNTALIGKYDGEHILGNYFDYSRKDDYRIPFVASKKFESRFKISKPPIADPTGKWRVEFSPGSDNEYLALGIFEQDGDRAFGTFLTTTGDYRYLDGNISGDSLLLSCFDGSHVFLFKARIDGNKIDGDFWSGIHWQENWVGTWDDTYELPDPTSLTFIKPGYSGLEFSFRNMQGETVSLDDDRYKGKVVIVQIMGSWCPNCMDETAYLVSLYNKFHQQGLEVISLAFEKSDNEETNIRSLARLKEHFNVPYEILLAGKASKTEASQKLPMLNQVLSFPTGIFLDRKGKVRRIHTGFSGPGTGEYYHEFVEETDQFVTQLLVE